MPATPDAAIAAQIVEDLIAQELIEARYAPLLERSFARGEFAAADWIALVSGELPAPPAGLDETPEDA
jgi:hypothetical protein